MFNQVMATKKEDLVYHQGYDSANAPTYSLLLYLNYTSEYVSVIWTAYAHELILRQFLKDQSGPDKKVSLNMTYLEYPYPTDRGVQN